MKQKHYIALAQALKTYTLTGTHFLKHGDCIYKPTFIEALCDILKAENKNFNADKFRETCK